MLRLALVSALALTALITQAQEAPPGPPAPPPLIGHVEGDDYFSPTGAFRVTVPVLPELGGTIRDTANVVTFQDAFTTHISIAAFPQDATQRWQLSTLGSKDYLKYFFDNFVRSDFTRAFKNVQVETNARFLPAMADGSKVSSYAWGTTDPGDGALIAYVLIPGGSMFTDRNPPLDGEDKVAVAKRGNMMFVKNGFIFVISTELAERITEGSTYKKTPDEEDVMLRERLLDIASRIRYPRPTPAP